MQSDDVVTETPEAPPREAVAPTAIAPRARTLDDYLKLVLNARVYDVARETA
ncbi:pyridoxal-phosphate dependent enzyme, partial [Burkholderia pseudomallei]